MSYEKHSYSYYRLGFYLKPTIINYELFLFRVV